MHVLLDNLGLFRRGFVGTVELTVVSTLVALLLGGVLTLFRIGPVPLLRGIGSTAVTLLCNTPLTLLFFGVTLGLPMLGLTDLSYFTLAVIALSAYSSAFLCEALRSGVNTVDTGQAEAARSLGLSFPQTALFVVLPQAGRAVLPPMSSVIITLAKNSALAGGFSVFEMFTVEKTLIEQGYAVTTVFLWVGLAYLVLIAAISAVFRFLERRLAVPR
ncbi:MULTISPECIES: amino acid ABC transporter permease [unclassified Streptomyces]|uniref:amino acid ABC transporter permease n=1 Tax=unclassified Streptomyces TaxID=2593676 RepID=UPI002DDB46A0|nr:MULTISPECIES: amino acid ABC transporter permease [unclassified Streptomyces]WSA90247.1 amino acid ABC transporter permease [Streptomyces sp. NBC_01795]WSB74473.1 amino acid ABC transporter permease [Streptomyces sp. NBC_01775]WSS45889.1 amino acid ABC transporter permease [Streptomyces sp. NBC_01187]